MGSERRRTPVASKIALPIAGARPTIGHSPAPADGRSLRSSRTVSSTGTSLKRGTRYLDKRPFRDAAVFEFNGLKKRAAQPHDVRALNLIAQVVGVDDGAALEGRDHPHNFHLAGLPVHRNFSTGRDVPQLFVSTAHAETLAGSGFGPPPAEFLGGRFEDCAQPLVLQVLQAEFERVHFYRMGQFVHERFARKVIRGGGQRAIRSLAQGRARAMKADTLVRDFIKSSYARRPRIVVMEFPRG